MKFLTLKTMSRFAQVVGFVALSLPFLADHASAQATGGWTLNINNAGNAVVVAGQDLSYVFRVENNEHQLTPATSIAFTLPKDTIYQGVDGPENCSPLPDPLTGQSLVEPIVVTCEVPELSLQQAKNVTVKLRPLREGVIELGAVMAAPGPSRIVRTTVEKGADLAVNLELDNAQVQAGAQTKFTAVLTNNGPYPSGGAKVTLPLPFGMSRKITVPTGCAIFEDYINCEIDGPIEPNTTIALDFFSQVTAEDISTIKFTAEVAPLGETKDPVHDNNLAEANLQVLAGTDVSLTKTRQSASPVLTGQKVSFTLTPDYAGTSPVQAVITDQLPDNYKFIELTNGVGWRCDHAAQLVKCEFSATEGAEFRTPIIITTEAIKPTELGKPVTNSAEISSESESEGFDGNNVASDTPVIVAKPKVDLVAKKTSPDRKLVTVGNEYDFRLSASNKGNIGFSGPLTITDFLPAGLTVTKIAADGWVCPDVPIKGATEIVCTTSKYTPKNPLEVSEHTDNIVLTTKVETAGKLVNTMLVSFPDYENQDADIKNNTASTGEITSADKDNWADVSLEKTVVGGEEVLKSVKSGESITFRLKVKNAGPAAALDVKLKDAFQQIVDENGGSPAKISYNIINAGGTKLSCTAVPGAGYSGDLDCNIPSLPVCGTIGTQNCPVVEVTVYPGSEGKKTNTATVFSVTTPDNNTHNNISSADYNVEAVTDITVEKSSASAQNGAHAGQLMKYVLTARAINGLSDAQDVVVTDTLPDGLIFVSAVPTVGSCVAPEQDSITDANNNKIICELGTLHNGSVENVSVNVIPTTKLVGTIITNNVEITTSTPEANTTNNSASLDVGILPPELDLVVTKSDDQDPVETGTDALYTITVENRGPSDATNVTITDTLPDNGFVNPRIDTGIAGLTPEITHVPDLPGGKIVYTVPRLKSREKVSFTYKLKAIKRGVYENSVYVASDETRAGYESIVSNNYAIEDTTVRVRSDISVTKVPNVDTVDLRQEFSWTITVTNKDGEGLDVAENVTLQDTLPSGMVLTHVPVISPAGAGRICSGKENDREVSCKLGDLNTGEVVKVTLFTKITDIKAEAASNTATVHTDSFEYDDKLGDNTSTGTVKTVYGSSISGKIYRDFNNNSILDDGQDSGIEDVWLTLEGIATHDNAVIRKKAQTTAGGLYNFGDLPPGTYRVSYASVNESHLQDGKALPGQSDAISRAVGHNLIENIVITGGKAAVHGTNQDFTLIPEPRIDLTKAAGTITYLDDGSYEIPYTLIITNPSLEPLVNIELKDVLGKTGRSFGTYTTSTKPAEGEYTIKAIEATFGNITQNFNGVDNEVVLSNGKLGANSLSGNASGNSGTVLMTVIVRPVVPLAIPVTAHINAAHVVANGEYSKQEVKKETSAHVTPKFNPKIELKKTHDYTPKDGVAQVNDEVKYSFTVTNTGNTPLFNIKLTDELVGLEGLDAATVISRLDPKKSDSTTFKAHYFLTQADLDSGKVPNKATATGEWSTKGDADKVSATAEDVVANLSKPGLTLLKETENYVPQQPSVVGEVIRYKFTVQNIGNTILNDVTITDQLAGVTADPAGAFSLGTMQPGDVETVYATYTVALKDIDAAQVHNIATAGGTTGPDKTPVPNVESEFKVPLFRNPKLELTKILAGTAPENPRVGDMLTWTVTAKNTGNVTLSNLVLGDDFADAVITPASVASLAPDATVDFTVTAPLKQSDIDAGEARNIAKINFNDPEEPQPPVDSNEVVTPLPQKPAIALKKTGDVSGLSSPPKVGEKITYTMVIRNTGNVALNNITLTDELPDFELDADDAARLQAVTLPAKTPANSLADTEITVHGTYALKAADIDAGKVTNIAETTGTSVVTPTDVVKDTSGTEFENDDPSVTDLTRDPQIRLIKTITDAALSTPPQVGDVITFGFEIRNTGNVTIEKIRIEDQVAGVVVHNTSGWTGPLEAGAANTDAFTATYALTQDDIDQGFFANTAKVIGSSVGGKPDDVTDISGTDIDNDTPTEQTFDKVTGLSIVKSETHALSTPPVPGDLITYSFVVTNTGNVTLTDVVVTDPLSDLDMPETTIATLLPGAANAVTLTATYAIKQSDIQKGEVKNKASVTGIYTDPNTKVPETVPPIESNEIVVPLDQVPVIAVVKSAVSALTEPAEEGQEITYTFTVTNTGNMELTDVKVEDPLPGINPSSFDAGDLAPNESKIFTAVYAITLADIDNEQVVNQATATGTYDDGSGPKTTTDLSGPDIHTDEELIVPVVPPVPELEIIKKGRWLDENGNGYPEVGEKIEYTFTITNIGNAVLFNVTPFDQGPVFNNKPATGKLSAFTPAPVTLKPQEFQEFKATYVLTQEDIDAAAGNGKVTNSATAKSNIRNGKEYESKPYPDEFALPATEPNDVTITKQAMLRQIKRGERVPYIIRVENSSTSNAGPVNVIDTMPAGFRYVEDSATLDGKPFVPVVNGRQIRFDNLPLGPKSTLEIRVDLLALSTAGPGKHTNVASVTDKTGTPIAKDAKAVVEIVAEPVFDCGDIVGKVFDDKNRNGYQDEGEPGLAGVRIATAKGWLVTTDEHGRFHVACAALPDQRIGSNFIMKLDPRTLPSGYRLTTENPRVVRLTAGKMTKLNFGAAIGRVVRLDVKGDAFEANSTELKRRWVDNISSLIAVLRKEPSVLRLSYVDANTKPELAKQRIKHLRDLITERWRKDGEHYQLEIETRSEVGK